MCFDKTASLIRKYDPDSALGPPSASKAPRPGVTHTHTHCCVSGDFDAVAHRCMARVCVICCTTPFQCAVPPDDGFKAVKQKYDSTLVLACRQPGYHTAAMTARASSTEASRIAYLCVRT